MEAPLDRALRGESARSWPLLALVLGTVGFTIARLLYGTVKGALEYRVSIQLNNVNVYMPRLPCHL